MNVFFTACYKTAPNLVIPPLIFNFFFHPLNLEMSFIQICRRQLHTSRLSRPISVAPMVDISTPVRSIDLNFFSDTNQSLYSNSWNYYTLSAEKTNSTIIQKCITVMPSSITPITWIALSAHHDPT